MAEGKEIKEDRFFMVFNHYKVKESDMPRFIDDIGPEEAVVLLVHATMKAGKEGCYTRTESEVLQKCLKTLIKGENNVENNNENKSKDEL